MTGRPRVRRIWMGAGLAAGALLVARLRPPPGDTAAGDATDAPAWEPPALQRLATWVPPPPATRAGRAAAYAWAAPLTLAGLLVGLGSGRRPRRHAGVLLFAEAGAVTGAVLRARGFRAAALGHVIVVTGQPSAHLLAHELTHIRHAERLGALLAPVYLGLLATHGYWRHPLERAARLAAAKTNTPVGQ